MAADSLGPLLPPQFPSARQYVSPVLFDPIANTRAAMRYLRARYGDIDAGWGGYRSAFRRFPVDDRSVTAPHGDALVSR